MLSTLLSVRVDRQTPYVSQNLVATGGTSCTTNEQQIEAMEMRQLPLTDL